MTPERLEVLKAAFGVESRYLGWYRCKEIVFELIAEVERLVKIEKVIGRYYDSEVKDYIEMGRCIGIIHQILLEDTP